MGSIEAKMEKLDGIANVNNLFAVDLYENLAKEPKGENFVFSPFSLSTVMAMLNNGARGKTQSQIQKVAHFPSNSSQVNEGYGQLLASFKNVIGGNTFTTANKIYVKNGFLVNKEFSHTLEKSFGAGAEQVDFTQNVAAAGKINDWVAKFSQGHIRDLIEAESLDETTRLVLLNGVYFKGFWKEKFDPVDTRSLDFHLNEREDVKADMMFIHTTMHYNVFEEIEAEVLALPYQGDQFCMIFYIPRSVTGLAKIENGLKKLSPLSEILQKLEHGQRMMRAWVPKFKIETTIPLVKPLMELGMTSMFEERKADFRGISESEPLYVSNAIQKAFIEVNEEGTKAVATTAITMSLCSCDCRPPFFVTIDRPFFFQIVDKTSKLVLFAGACHNPTV